MIKQMTSKDLLESHLPHRLSVLGGFLDCPQEPWARNVYNAAKDGAMVTCRALWQLMGVVANSKAEQDLQAPLVPLEAKKGPSSRSIGGMVIDQFTVAEVEALLLYDDLRLVLVAANKCVAHLDDHADHGVDHEILKRVVNLTIGEVKKRIPNIVN